MLTGSSWSLGADPTYISQVYHNKQVKDMFRVFLLHQHHQFLILITLGLNPFSLKPSSNVNCDHYHHHLLGSYNVPSTVLNTAYRLPQANSLSGQMKALTTSRLTFLDQDLRVVAP